VNQGPIDRQLMASALFAAAALSSLAALPLYFVGEEGILAITSLEMWHRGEWLHLWLFGGDQSHGMFANWLIIPVASMFGWDKVLQVTRTIMIVSTAATGGVLFLLVHRLYRNHGLAVFAAAVYVTFADVLFYRGWLGYRDPLFGFLVFSSVATLWIAAKERRLGWLGASCVLLTLAFLTKGLTAYVFFASAAVILALQARERSFLLRPTVLFLVVLSALAPLLWFQFVLGGTGTGARMTSEILDKLSLEGAGAYALKLVAYPVEVLLRLAPASLLALFYLYRQPAARGVLASDVALRTALLIGLLGFLPYWLAPQSHIRYLAPVLPLFALVIAVAIWSSGERPIVTTTKWLWAAVALKMIVVLAVFPYYQQHYRGENYAAAARDITARTTGHPLYTNNVSASGLSVAAHIDILRLPLPPLTFPPAKWDSGFVIVYEPDATLGRVTQRYRLGGDDLYLLCRGTACNSVIE
jgi:4-amino-4-deoxy-L-arabinose transferase-like glycosyltransferase